MRHRRSLLAETSAHVLHATRHGRSGRAAVIKVARDDVEPLARELEALRALEGPGVVELIDVEGDPPRALALARIQGPTLEARIRRRLLAADELARLARRLAAVMQRIWDAGWVHGDLKPTNVMLPRGDLDRAVLVDFETARRVGEPHALRLSTAFTAPERVVGSPAADVAADVFSLGALLHACRAGASPFDGPSRDASLIRVLAHEPPVLEGIDRRLAASISAMLEKDPGSRHRGPLATLDSGSASRPRGARIRPTARPAALPAAIAATLRAGQRLIVVAGDAASTLQAVSRWAAARARLLAEAEPSEEPYGSLEPALRRAIGVGESPPFRAVLAALARHRRLRLSRRSSLHLAELLGAEPDAASRRALAPAHADAELLRRVRREAVLACLGALPMRGPVVTVAAGIDGSSRDALEMLIRGAAGRRLRVIAAVGALDLESAAIVEGGGPPRARPSLAPQATDGAADPVPIAVRGRLAAAHAARHPHDLGRVAQLFAAARQPLRAAYYAWRAAERAFEASDLPRSRALLFLADESLAETRGSVRSLLGGLVEVTRARLERWAGDSAGAGAATRRALASLPSGSAAFCDALGERATITGKLGELGEVLAVAAALREAPAADAALSWDRATSRAAVQLFYAGERAAADGLVALFRERTTLASGRPDRRRRALSPGALVTASLFAGRLDEHLELLEEAVTAFRAIGDVRSVCLYGSAAGFALCQLGAYARAEQLLRRVLARATRTDIPTLRALAEHNLGEALAHRPGRLAEAIVVEGRAIDALRRERDLRLLAGSLAYRARMHLGARDLDSAERDAGEAVEAGGTNANLIPLLFGTLAEVELRRSRADQARIAAERAVSGLEGGAPIEAGESLARLALARSLVAQGDIEGGRAIAAGAWRLVRERAERLRPGPLKSSFLGAIPEHRALRRLAEGEA